MLHYLQAPVSLFREGMKFSRYFMDFAICKENSGENAESVKK